MLFQKQARRMIERLEAEGLSREFLLAQATADIAKLAKMLTAAVAVAVVLALAVAGAAVGWKFADLGYKEFAREVASSYLQLTPEAECRYQGGRKHLECDDRRGGEWQMEIGYCDLRAGGMTCKRRY